MFGTDGRGRTQEEIDCDDGQRAGQEQQEEERAVHIGRPHDFGIFGSPPPLSLSLLHNLSVPPSPSQCERQIRMASEGKVEGGDGRDGWN